MKKHATESFEINTTFAPKRPEYIAPAIEAEPIFDRDAPGYYGEESEQHDPGACLDCRQGRFCEAAWETEHPGVSRPEPVDAEGNIVENRGQRPRKHR